MNRSGEQGMERRIFIFGITENTGLIVEGEIASDNDGGALVKAADQMEQ
jgi:hypothetical protein